MPEEFSVGQGIFEAMDKWDDEPLENEQWLWPDIYSMCAGRGALFVYSFQANQVYRCPKA